MPADDKTAYLLALNMKQYETCVFTLIATFPQKIFPILIIAACIVNILTLYTNAVFINIL